METNTTSLFELQVDHEASIYLRDAARWAKFLAIMGFIGCGFCLLAGIGLGAGTSGDLSTLGASSGMRYMSGTAIAIVYFIIALLYFFPCLYTFNFARKIQAALRSNDQVQLNEGFRNLKACYRFLGILTAIWLGLMAIVLLFTITVAIFRR
ncbi:DUF5362 family protein [Flavitalea sp. BT771]|uniref:DUF5362 family protein n=1 Tax=Flavitalea sp. BT771 TaxID=3063329 RepID=UPI0026E48698|nr:DUF5362 family protein [Flavitalea sp. BT771]MDO6431214.1 DUF5362 family protein [Flavitalea sp. BT771]MDV6220121.1 DUF5362 family protein [Flavitalea sp. BT771]